MSDRFLPSPPPPCMPSPHVHTLDGVITLLQYRSCSRMSIMPPHFWFRGSSRICEGVMVGKVLCEYRRSGGAAG
jgi:hypothetical protein